MSSAKSPERAFHWIIDLLEKNKVPFQVTGGLAAKAYGSPRELADIDLDVPEALFTTIRPLVEKYIEFGPSHYKDNNWDLELMTLSYCGQEIDLGGALEAKVFDQSSKQWVVIQADFSTSEMKQIFGRTVPVVAKEALIEYKKKLAREVDLIDVANLEAPSS